MSRALLILPLVLMAPLAAWADDVGGDEQEYWDVVETASIAELMTLEGIAPLEDTAPLWGLRDPVLQNQVEAALANLELEDEASNLEISVALIDMPAAGKARLAAVNGDKMMYAASLPKIAILLAAFEKISRGEMVLDQAMEYRLGRMIQVSSNREATYVMNEVGKEFIAQVLLSPRYRLYDPAHGGGLWVGKDYAKGGLWRRDPIYNLSHGATAIQVARFYYLLENEQLVTPEYSRKMKEILLGSELDHKFLRVLRKINPLALIFRKSGSWSTYHSDSVLVERDGRAYIAVVLSHSPRGADWLAEIISAFDSIIYPAETLASGAPRAVEP